MKYVLLGKMSREGIAAADRLTKARAKLAELGITIESLYFTQGEFDFVDVMDAPDAEAMLAFSIWYAKQGFGQIRSMPAFDEATMDRAVARA